VIVYDAAYLRIAVFFKLLWRYAASRDGHLLAKDTDREMADKLTQQYNYGPLARTVAIALAWISIGASLLINLVLACFFAIPPHYASKHIPARKRASISSVRCASESLSGLLRLFGEATTSYSPTGGGVCEVLLGSAGGLM